MKPHEYVCLIISWAFLFAMLAINIQAWIMVGELQKWIDERRALCAEIRAEMQGTEFDTTIVRAIERLKAAE